MLEESIKSCPFKVLGFHADNGSEYIDHRVAEMLNGLHVPEFTKSRSDATRLMRAAAECLDEHGFLRRVDG